MFEMKIDRLLGITIYLLNHGRTSSSFLAEYFEVSTRTIMRDIDTLCLAGIPVSSNCGVDGGYEIMETFEMNKQIVGEIDYNYVVCALQGLASAYAHKDIEVTLEKMKNLAASVKTNTNAKMKNSMETSKQTVNNNINNTMILDLSVAHENRDTNKMLFLLNKSIQHQKRIKFTYTNARDERKEVEVEPVSTIYKWYNWYLIGYCLIHQDYRLYKVVRMDHLILSNKGNDRIHNIKEVKDFLNKAEDQRKMLRVSLRCKENLKSKCGEYFRASITKIFENGDFECELVVPEEEQFWYGVLLSFGGDVKVLEPPELIARVKKDCRNMLQNHIDTDAR